MNLFIRSCFSYIKINSDSKNNFVINRCWSFIGKTGGQQPLSLTPPKDGRPNCLGSIGKPIHELLHALGVFHEHSRFDRDGYITIQKDNINPS